MYKPIYTIDSDMLNAISEIAEIKVIVERSPVLPLNELESKRQALVRMVHTSTSIEGNKLAEYQVGKVLSGQEVDADNKSWEATASCFPFSYCSVLVDEPLGQILTKPLVRKFCKFAILMQGSDNFVHFGAQRVGGQRGCLVKCCCQYFVVDRLSELFHR